MNRIKAHVVATLGFVSSLNAKSWCRISCNADNSASILRVSSASLMASAKYSLTAAAFNENQTARKSGTYLRLVTTAHSCVRERQRICASRLIKT